jgi:hypothetical protein
MPLLALALAVPASAVAQEPTVIDGSPLKIFTDESGRIQVNVDGRDLNEFFPQSSAIGNAGLGLVFDPQGSPIRYGFGGGGAPSPTLGPVLKPGDPATITTEWDLDGAQAQAFHVQQVLSYRNGNRQFDSVYTVTNNADGPVALRALVAGDLAIRGSDIGVGLFQGGPPRFVGGLNQDVGGTGGFVEETPWSHFQSGSLGDVGTAASGDGFTDVVSPELVDNAAGVQWDFPAVQPRSSVTFSTGWRFVNTLGITPTTATQQTGNAQSFSVQTGDLNGQPLGKGKDVLFSVSGANETKPTKTETDSAGHTTFAYVGGNHGTDEVTAFVDQNGNGAHDGGEPQATAQVIWKGPEAPIQGETANARPEKGTVRVKLPPGANGATARRAAKHLGVPLSAAQGSFTKLTENTPIPMGSTLDTTKGTVRLLTASKATKQTGGSPFSGFSFNGATFTLRQKGSKGVTELTMKGGELDACHNGLPSGGARKLTAARKRGRKLFGSGRGRFRTRGRNSSASVRGTKYLVKDTCKGTLTRVMSGSVVVRDFTRKRSVTVKKGHKYLAKPPKRH